LSFSFAARCKTLEAGAGIGDGREESKVAMLVAVQSKALEVRFRAETHYREELERRRSG